MAVENRIIIIIIITGVVVAVVNRIQRRARTQTTRGTGFKSPEYSEKFVNISLTGYLKRGQVISVVVENEWNVCVFTECRRIVWAAIKPYTNIGSEKKNKNGNHRHYPWNEGGARLRRYVYGRFQDWGESA